MSEDYVKDCENCDHCDINAGMICVIQKCIPSFLGIEGARRARQPRIKTEKIQRSESEVSGKGETAPKGEVLRKPSKKRAKRKKSVSKKRAKK